jgi:photosystem II stability/assembly factor-like uncharacterized protein
MLTALSGPKDVAIGPEWKRVAVRIFCALSSLAFLVLLSPTLRAQDSPDGSQTPHAATSKAQGGDVLWYGNAPPGWGGVVGKMKLLAPGIGWAERGGRLYRTSDNGANWKDITPPLDTDERLDSIFFLDSSRGWIGINHAQDLSKQLQFDVASSSDAGATWSRVTVSLPLNRLPTGAVAGGGVRAIAFVDSLHGWISVAFGGETMNLRWTELMLTSDGGKTWKEAAGAPNALNAEMLLVSPSEGWLYGGEALDINHLYVTRDGARSWQEVAPSIPDSMYSEVRRLPTFEDAKHGFLEVTGPHRVGENLRSTLVLFKTSDGGRTWQSDRIVTNLNDISERQYSSAAVVDSDWVFAAASDHVPVLTKVGSGASIDASSNPAGSPHEYKVISQISFATPTQGWVIVGDGDLVSTSDGGATWTALTPGPQPHVIQPHGSFIPRQSMRSSTAAGPSKVSPR